MRLLQGKAAGAVSGGTIPSLMGALFEETPEEIKFSADPYCLNPPEAHRCGFYSLHLSLLVPVEVGG